MIVKEITHETFNLEFPTLQDEVFGKQVEEHFKHFDSALVVYVEDRVVSYATTKKLSSDLVFLEMGGAAPSFKGTSYVPRSFLGMVEHLFETYKEITMSVRNNNFPMLRLALKLGFLITGTQLSNDGQLMLLHSLGRE